MLSLDRYVVHTPEAVLKMTLTEKDDHAAIHKVLMQYNQRLATIA